VISVSNFKELNKKDQNKKLSETKLTLEKLKTFCERKADNIVNVLLPNKILSMNQHILEINRCFEIEKSNPCVITVDEISITASEDKNMTCSPPKKNNENQTIL